MERTGQEEGTQSLVRFLEEVNHHLEDACRDQER